MKSLRLKVFLGVLGGLLMVALGAEVVLYRQAISFAEKELFDSLRRYATALTEIAYIDPGNGLQIHYDWENTVKIGLDDRAEFFEFKNPDGTFITDSHNLGGESLPEVGVEGGYKLVDFGNVLLGVYEHHFSLPTEDQNQQTFVLLVAHNTGLVTTARKATLRTVMFVTPLILIAAFVVSFGLTAITLASISKFRMRVAELEDTDTKTRLNLQDVDTEMKPLGQALNTFIDQINHQLVSESRLLADTAHELRTPLVTMRTELEQLQKGSPTTSEIKQGLKEVNKGITGLQRMTDNMLMLYRIESGKYHPRLSSLNLQVELKRYLKKSENEYQEEGVRVQLQGDPVKVCSNRSVIELMVNQLVRNASMYAPDSPIEISWQQVDENVLLHIDDSGEGIPEFERERVFDRRYRITDHIHQQPSGGGLGLSLVRLYAESVNAVTQCLASPTGGARFTITMPAECKS